MTDDKAIEAACEAIRLDRPWLYEEEATDIARAALAAAEKVRAGGFDFAGQSRAIVNTIGDFDDEIDVAEDALRRAFAAGLAKGEAERAALVKALDRVIAGVRDDRSA